MTPLLALLRAPYLHGLRASIERLPGIGLGLPPNLDAPIPARLVGKAGERIVWGGGRLRPVARQAVNEARDVR